jgi:hypothetical protein
MFTLATSSTGVRGSETPCLARLDCVAVCNPHTLWEVDELRRTVLAELAVYIGKTRPIDNALLSVSQA